VRSSGLTCAAALEPGAKLLRQRPEAAATMPHIGAGTLGLVDRQTPHGSPSIVAERRALAGNPFFEERIAYANWDTLWRKPRSLFDRKAIAVHPVYMALHFTYSGEWEVSAKWLIIGAMRTVVVMR
jgi:hypothetical protein